MGGVENAKQSEPSHGDQREPPQRNTVLDGSEKLNLYYDLDHLSIKFTKRTSDRSNRQRMGEDLDGMSIQELRGLEQNLDEALKVIRQRKVQFEAIMEAY